MKLALLNIKSGTIEFNFGTIDFNFGTIDFEIGNNEVKKVYSELNRDNGFSQISVKVRKQPPTH